MKISNLAVFIVLNWLLLSCSGINSINPTENIGDLKDQIENQKQINILADKIDKLTYEILNDDEKLIELKGVWSIYSSYVKDTILDLDSITAI